MKIAIKNTAPLGANQQKWGDYHFGASLQKALEERGVSVVQHYWPEWDRDDGEDVILVLRGKRKFSPPAGKATAMWVMSHPATVSVEEVNQYDIVFVASEQHRNMLAPASETPVELMRQCTDVSLFAFPEIKEFDREVARRREIIFVANSRGIRRDMIQWADRAGCYPSLIGRHWKSLDLSQQVKQEYVNNEDLPLLYRSSRLSLNDHWGDMLHFGAINNRIFDCLASGLPVLSDHFSELESVCGGGLLYASNSQEYWAAIKKYTLRYPEVIENAWRLWERIGDSYTFAARADQLLAMLDSVSWRDGSRKQRDTESKETLQHSDVQSLTDDMMRRYASISSKQEYQLFHLCPTVQGTYHLSSQAGISYLSGGFGSGPWHVPLALDAGHIVENRFDMILLEDLHSLLDTAGEEVAIFVANLAGKLKDKGLFGCLRPTESVVRVFEDKGMRCLDNNAEYAIFQRCE